MRTLLIAVLLVLFLAPGKAQVYMCRTSDISFFSKTALEDIDAVCHTVCTIFSATKNEIAVKVTIKDFDFKSELMEEHFNEKYLESDKYPIALFTGKINEKVDYSKDGTSEVTVTGKLNIHGVEKERTIPGTLTLKDGVVTVFCKFMVALVDHKIEVPSIVGANVAETIEVTVNGALTKIK